MALFFALKTVHFVQHGFLLYLPLICVMVAIPCKHLNFTPVDMPDCIHTLADELFIMGGGNNRAAAACAGEGAAVGAVQMIGGLVQYQEVGPLSEGGAQRPVKAPAAVDLRRKILE